MGWLFMSSLGAHSSPKAYLDAQYHFTNDQGTSEILASAVVKMSTYYAACRQTRADTGATRTFALVCLVKYNLRDREGMIFGYKDMSETMGPCEAECPARILDLLDPTTSEYALDWRARCRASIARRARPSPKDGDTILFSEQIRFSDGHEGKRFLVRWIKTRILFINPSNGNRYSISNWKDRAWTCVPKIDLSRAAA